MEARRARRGRQCVKIEPGISAIDAIAARRGIAVTVETVQTLAASPSEPGLLAMLDAAVVAAGVAPHRLLSGAGHDAMMVAAIAPTAMLFIRCAGGVSHNAAESVDPLDCGKAVTAMVDFVDRLGQSYRPA